MKRTGPPKRKTRLGRGKALARRALPTGSKRSTGKPFAKAPPDPVLVAFRAAVRRRSRGRCEVGAPPCTTWAHAAHHVKRGTPRVHDPAFGLDTCTPCHEYLHAHVAESYARGWLVRRGGL